jgi:hypothetical protein
MVTARRRKNLGPVCRFSAGSFDALMNGTDGVPR